MEWEEPSVKACSEKTAVVAAQFAQKCSGAILSFSDFFFLVRYLMLGTELDAKDSKINTLVFALRILTV